MAQRDTSRDVAIIGMACRFADAESPSELWENLKGGRRSFRPFPSERWNHADFHSDRFRQHDKTYVSEGAFIEDVDSFPALHFGVAPRRVEVMDPQHRLVLETTRRALQDAGAEVDGLGGLSVGTFLGVSTSEYRNLVTSRTMAVMMAGGATGNGEGTGEALSRAVENVAPISAFSMPGTLLNMTAANVASTWGFDGPAYTVDAACASSLVAVHDAVTQIRAGTCDAAIAGGVYLNLTPEALIGFSRIGAISQKGACRPFDAEADGFLQGDGCGIVVLKRYDRAVADGDRIHAVIRGSGINNDAGSSSGPMAPSLEGQMAAVRAAYRDAGIDPATVGFVACHGTATPVGDPVEVEALRQVVDDGSQSPVYLGSVKGNIGHTMSAAGVAGLMHAVLALGEETIPPQAGFGTAHPKLEIGRGRLRVPTEAVAWPRGAEPRRAGVSAFGFGGTNCHLVIEEPEYAAEARPAEGSYPFVVSAGTKEMLAGHAREVARVVETTDASLADISHTLTVTRRPAQVRLAVVAQTREELALNLRSAADALDAGAEGPVLGPDAFVGEESEAPGVAFMFPGQGAQRVGLLADLYERYPRFRELLGEVWTGAQAEVGATLESLLYPNITDEELPAAEAALRATETCQPVMAALGLALSSLLRELGVEPAVCLGHSLGEFAAAAAGGIVEPAAAVGLAARRGRLMADLDAEDFGAMAAIMAAPESIAGRLGDDVVIANINHPEQTVIAGPTAAVAAVVEAFDADGIKATGLRVSHAFHSPVVAPVASGMRAAVDALALAPAQIPVVSAITGAPYADVDSTRETFVQHATSAVDFVAALRAARAQGASVFVEVGAGTTLTAFARGAFADVAARSLGGKTPDGARSFHRTLCHLFALGVRVQFAGLSPRGRLVTLPVTPLATSRHWVVRDKSVPLEVPASSLVGESMPSKTPSNESELVALFREQNEILRQHAAVIAAQTAILSGQGVDAAVLDLPAVQAPRVSTDSPQARTPAAAAAEEPAASVGGGEPPSQDFEQIVLESVAGVSAFPRQSLGLGQKLALDLGFDSLMFVDLGVELQKRMPGLQIPQTAFDQDTTIADVIAFLESREIGGGGASEPEGPVRRFVVDWVPMERPTLPGRVPAGQIVITASGVDPGAEALQLRLEEAGFTARVLDLQQSEELGSCSGIVHLADRAAAWDSDRIARLRRLAAQLVPGAPELFAVVANTDADPAMRGALRGFAKAFAREVSGCRVHSIACADSELFAVPQELATPVSLQEIRLADGGRFTLAAVESEKRIATELPGASDVVLVTGGARGIALQCATALAANGAALILAGRSPQSAISAELESLRAKGARVGYVQWDVSEPAPAGLGELVQELGAVTWLVHAAGVIRDAKLTEKTDADVAAVTRVKVNGLRNALDAVGGSLRGTVAFGSWAGRLGNASQVDYAAANDALSEMTRELAAAGRAAVTIDWPMWEESAMVETVPQAVRTAMKAAGVTFLTPAEGVEAFVDELRTASTGEVLLARTLPTDRLGFESAFEASLQALPYVADHVLKDVPVVPFATALDWLASVARRGVRSSASTHLAGVELYKGLELDAPLPVIVRASDDGFAEIVSGDVVCYRARILEPAPLSGSLVRNGEPTKVDLPLDEFYSRLAFHGPALQAIVAIDEIADEWLTGRVRTGTPLSMGAGPHDTAWDVDPLVIDGSFQLVLYHLQAKHGKAAFPVAIDDYRQLRPFVGDEVACELVLREMKSDTIVGDIHYTDADGLAAIMTGLRAREFTLERSESEPGSNIPAEHWDVAHFPEVIELEQRLQMAELIGIRNPYFWPHDGPARNTAIIDGREMKNFSSYNYCGFSGHPEVSKAAQDAIARYGTSVSASRLASGQIPLHQELEDAISQFVGTEAALVFSAGHMTNETCIGHLFGSKDLIIHDSLAHNSILTGAELSGAKRMQFPHSDWRALDRILSQIRGNYEKVGIFIEGVYSMDGDIPELPRFIEMKKKHRCLLYVDEAHSIGVIGPRGAGAADYFGIDPMEVDVWMGTLSKAFASCGGYIAGSARLVQYLKYTAPAFVFSAGISPANAGAALASVRLLGESPEIPRTLQARANYFVEACRARGLDTGLSKDSAVVPVIVGNSLECLRLSQQLAERGINVQPIVYPAVDDESSRLRFFLSAVHTEAELAETADIVADELGKVRSGAAAE